MQEDLQALLFAVERRKPKGETLLVAAAIATIAVLVTATAIVTMAILVPTMTLVTMAVFVPTMAVVAVATPPTVAAFVATTMYGTEDVIYLSKASDNL